MYLEFRISISITQRALRQGTEKRKKTESQGSLSCWPPLISIQLLAARWRRRRRRDGKEAAEEGTRSCFDNQTPPFLPKLPDTSFYPPTHPSTSDLSWSPGIRSGTGTKQPSQALTKWCSEDTRQQRLLEVTGQHSQCQWKHVIPALQCSDANPYLPRQLFYSPVEGTPDTSQPVTAPHPLNPHLQLKSTSEVVPACNLLWIFIAVAKKSPLRGEIIYSFVLLPPPSIHITSKW